MDPLSITVSAIALGGFVTTVGKGIKALRSLGDAPDEFCALLNELKMLQMVASKVRDLSISVPATDLDTFRDDLAQTVGRLESLVSRFEKSSKGLDRHGQHRIPPIRWRRERTNIERLRDQARRTRDYITTYLTTVTASERQFTPF